MGRVRHRHVYSNGGCCSAKALCGFCHTPLCENVLNIQSMGEAGQDEADGFCC